MNERIQALAVEAGLIVSEWDGFNRRQLDVAERRFAELIVQECADIAAEKKTQHEQATQDFEYESPDWFWATRTTQALRCVEADIKQHFEVAE